jgi:hypothetical protein
MTIDHWQAFWDRPSVPSRPLALGPEDSPVRPLEPRRMPFEVCLAYEYDSALAEYAGATVPIELVKDGDRQVVVQGRVGTATPDEPATLDGLAHIASVESVIVDRPVRLTRSLPQVRELIVTTGVSPPGTEVLQQLPNLLRFVRGWRTQATLLALCGLALLCTACLVWEPRDTRGVTITNRTDETITVFVLYPAGESALNTYRPGESSVENNMLNQEDGCTRFDMVARTEDGREIDRQPPPICRDEEWRISEDE